VLVTAAVVFWRRPGAARARLGQELPPIVLAVAGVMLWPAHSFAGASHLALRFNVFWLPFLIAWLQPRPTRWMRAALCGGAVAVAVVLTVGFRAFDAQARDYEALAARIPPRTNVRPLVFLANTDDTDFLHFPVWTQAERGGLAGFSFAANFTSLVRYRDPAPDLMKRDEEWQPERFDWRRELGKGYGAYVVLSDVDRTEALFAGAPIELVARSGRWWLYRPLPRSSSR
jgi:hypothetical protein